MGIIRGLFHILAEFFIFIRNPEEHQARVVEYLKQIEDQKKKNW